MFLTITADSDDLSYLLFKHPDRVQQFDLGYGTATLWFPVAEAGRYQAALLVDVDQVTLAQSKRFRVRDFELGAFINDRAWAASSLLAVAIARVFGSALKGQDPKESPGAAAKPHELTLHLPSVRLDRRPSGDADADPTSIIAALFEPLGWEVTARQTPHADSLVADVTLTGVMTLQTALSQLYVLLPVLDGSKHYWVAEAEIEKLLRYAEGWLPAHPLREQITSRYLAHQRELIDAATQLLVAEEGNLDVAGSIQPPRLAQQRLDALVATLKSLGVKSVLDLGCGEGKLVRELLNDSSFTQVTGADVSATVLKRAEQRMERISDRQRVRMNLIQASGTYRDERFAGFDAVVLSEVIEHLDPDRLVAFERTIFEAAPKQVLITTPNAEYNQLYGLAPGSYRHPDHRFEWSRAEFEAWATAAAEHRNYQVHFVGIGEATEQFGAPTQMAVFTQVEA